MHARWQPSASFHTFDVFSRRCVPQQIYVLVPGVMPASLTRLIWLLQTNVSSPWKALKIDVDESERLVHSYNVNYSHGISLFPDLCMLYSCVKLSTGRN